MRWCIVLFAVAFTGAHLDAQTVQFTGVQSIMQGQWAGSMGAVSDSEGNIYIANLNSGTISKISALDGSTTSLLSNLGGQLIRSPQMLAIGPNNTLYIAEQGNNRVDVYSLNTGTYYSVGVVSVVGVAVDASGNIFTTSDLGTSSFVSMISAGKISPTTISSGGYSSLSGIALDATGNVYVSDQTGHTVYKLAYASWSRTSYLALTSGQRPYGIMFDAAQYLYVADAGQGEVYRYSSKDLSNPVPLMTSNPCCEGIALDPKGNIYVTNNTSNAVIKFTQGAYNFGTTNVGSTSAVVSLSFSFNAGGTLGNSPRVVTQGASGLDFTDVGSGSCTTNGPNYVYSMGDICTVDVTFSPKLSGRRDGAVVLTNSGNSVLATGYVYGTGSGPQISFQPGIQSVVTSRGLYHPRGLTADENGNLYIADTDNNRVLKETLSGDSYSESTIASTGLLYPIGIAIDGAGNVYIGDCYHGRIVKETLSGEAYTESTVVRDIGCPGAIAIDGSGNMYIAQGSGNFLLETPSPSGYIQTTVVASGLSDTVGIAVDGSGNLYISDYANNKVIKETLSNGVYGAGVIPTSELNHPRQISVDILGNIFIADANNGRVLKETLIGSSYVESVVSSGLREADSVSVDGVGNVYIADTSHGQVLKLNHADAPSLVFSVMEVGATSNVQTVILQNIGNAPLAFTVPASGSNPAVSANFSIDDSVANACPQTSTNRSAGASLVPGVSCVVTINFSPTTTGFLQGNIVVGDTNLNAANALQVIALAGTGSIASTNLVLSAPTSTVYGNRVQIVASITTGQTNNSALNGTIVFSDQNGSLGSKAVVDGSATQSYFAPSIGSFTLNGVFTPSNANYNKSSGQATLTVTAAPLTATVQNVTRVYGAANSSFQGTVIGAVNHDSITESFTTSATAQSPVGSYAIKPVVAGANLTGYTSTLVEGTLTIVPAPLVATAANIERMYGTANPLLSGSLSGAVNGDTLPASYSTVAQTTDAVGQYPITAHVTGSALNNYILSIVSGVLAVQKAGTFTTLDPQKGVIAAGATIQLQAHVVSITTGVPGGTVRFYNSKYLLGEATLQNGTAVYSTTVLSVGSSNMLIAIYQADVNFLASSSDVRSITIQGSGLSVKAVAPGMTVHEGDQAAFLLNVDPGTTGMYPDVVTFSVTGLPNGAMATFSPATLAASSGNQTIAMTVQTKAQAASASGMAHTDSSWKSFPLVGGSALALVLLPLAGAHRLRKASMSMLLTLLVLGGIAGSMALIGCGVTRNTAFGNTPNAQTTTYVLTVTATSGGVQQTVMESLILQP